VKTSQIQPAELQGLRVHGLNSRVHQILSTGKMEGTVRGNVASGGEGGITGKERNEC